MTAQPASPAPGHDRPGIRRGSIDSLQRAGRACLQCGRLLDEGELLTAVLVEVPLDRKKAADSGQDFERMDYCPDCWADAPWSEPTSLMDEGQRAWPTDRYGAEPVAVWTARVGPAEKKKRTFVDDRVLTRFFLRLADADDPRRLRFRFVLMLILMRHRKLRHVGTARGDGPDVWRVRLMPAMAEATATDPDEIHEVLDPELGEAEIGAVADQLKQILHEDFDYDDDPGAGPEEEPA